MDLSTGGDLAQIRKAVMGMATVAIGTVPIYQAAVKILQEKKAISEMTAEDIFSVIEENGKDGVDFIYCSLRRDQTECCGGGRAGKNFGNCQPRRRHDCQLDVLQ